MTRRRTAPEAGAATDDASATPRSTVTQRRAVIIAGALPRLAQDRKVLEHPLPRPVPARIWRPSGPRGGGTGGAAGPIPKRGAPPAGFPAKRPAGWAPGPPGRRPP